MRRTIAGLLFAIFAVPASAQLPGPPPVPPAQDPAHCTASEYGQLDFWLGEWNVFETADQTALRGVSKIEKVYFGCAIREEWSPFTLLNGGSVNAWDREAKVWRQAWVDSMGGWADLSGTWQAGKMVMTGKRGSGLNRLTLSPGAGGTVRQISETSDDGGKTWKPWYDFTYKRR